MPDRTDPSNFALTEHDLSIRLLKAMNKLYARVWHGVEVHSPCTLPTSGAALLISNHTSGIDPSLVQSACTRLIRWMMAKEYYDQKLAGRVYRQVGAIAVARSGRDLVATRLALRALEAGHVLGVFPEGKIAPSRELLPFQAGVALLAIKSGAPVFPARLDGSQRGLKMGAALTHRQHATLVFGPEVMFDRSSTRRDTLEAATAAMRAAVQRLDPNAR